MHGPGTARRRVARATSVGSEGVRLRRDMSHVPTGPTVALRAPSAGGTRSREASIDVESKLYATVICLSASAEVSVSMKLPGDVSLVAPGGTAGEPFLLCRYGPVVDLQRHVCTGLGDADATLLVLSPSRTSRPAPGTPVATMAAMSLSIRRSLATSSEIELAGGGGKGQGEARTETVAVRVLASRFCTNAVTLEHHGKGGRW